MHVWNNRSPRHDPRPITITVGTSTSAWFTTIHIKTDPQKHKASPDPQSQGHSIPGFNFVFVFFVFTDSRCFCRIWKSSLGSFSFGIEECVSKERTGHTTCGNKIRIQWFLLLVTTWMKSYLITAFLIIDFSLQEHPRWQIISFLHRCRCKSTWLRISSFQYLTLPPSYAGFCPHDRCVENQSAPEPRLI